MSKLKYLVLPLVTALAITGCKDTRSEAGNPKFIRAKKLYEHDKYSEAVDAFNSYLIVNPESVKAHRYLADLYHDHMEEPLNAIYHYRRILILDPMSPEKEIIGKFLQSAETKYYKKLEERYADAGDIGVLEKELDSMKIKAAKYYRIAVQLNKQKKELAARLAQKDKQVLELETQVLEAKRQAVARPQPAVTPEVRPEPISIPEPTTTARSSTPTRPAVSTRSAQSPSQPRTTPTSYVIQPGDNLMLISKKVYGTTKHFKTIFQANKDIMPSISRLKVGLRIRIPKIK